MKVKVFTPPEIFKLRQSIFLAGTIEMGKSIDWQQQVIEALKDYDVDIYNPRRADWDSSWVQSIDCPQFKEQVEWELNALEDATIILMNFIGGTLSPISLLELGLYARSRKLMVVCPDDYWRKGNVDVVCNFYNVIRFNTLEQAIIALKYTA